MPFGEYQDFNECVEANKDKESPEGWCAELHKKITGEYPSATKSERIGLVWNYLEQHPEADISLKGIESIVNAFEDWAGKDPGNFTECVSVLSGKEGIPDPESLCAWLHNEALGKWPAEKSAALEGTIVLKSEAQRLVFGPVLVPGEEDSEGEVVSAEKIEEVALKFMEDFRYIDLSHTLKAAGVPVLSEILRRDEAFPMGSESMKLPKGTWMLGVRVSKEDWPRVVKGELKGFSIMAIPKDQYDKIAQKGLPIGAKLEGGVLKKVLLSDLGPDWVVAAVSILENPSVKKSRYVSVKGILGRLFRRFAIKDNNPNKEESEMTPEELNKAIDERVDARLKAEAEAKAAKEKEEEEAKAKAATQEPPPPPPATPEQVQAVEAGVEAVKGEVKKLGEAVQRITALVTKSRSLGLTTPEPDKSDRDMYGRKAR